MASQAKLKKSLDVIFSHYIRLFYSDKDGYVRCFTCGKRAYWKEVHCGHFVSRQYLSTRWDENNCRPQCVGDNIFGGGKSLDFEEKLVEQIGRKKVDDLKKRRHEIWKLDERWYVEKINHYKNEVKKLLTPPLD